MPCYIIGITKSKIAIVFIKSSIIGLGCTQPGTISINAAFYLEEGDEGYDKYIIEHQGNPFCNHSIQFEADVTDEEILYCFELALEQTHLNYLVDDLHCVKETTAKTVNQDIGYLGRRAFYAGIKQIPKKDRTAIMKSAIKKIADSEERIKQIKKVDFAKVKTIGTYRVK